MPEHDAPDEEQLAHAGHQRHLLGLPDAHELYSSRTGLWRVATRAARYMAALTLPSQTVLRLRGAPESQLRGHRNPHCRTLDERWISGGTTRW